MKNLLKVIVLICAAYLPFNVGSQCGAGGIVFSSQTDVDNFATNYPGCTQIIGNVNINGGNIVNLNGLSGVTSIGGHLFIQNNPVLTNMTGLSNLTAIGGYLLIINNASLTNLNGLNSLSSVYLMQIDHNNSLASLSGLSSLTSVSRVDVFSNPSLTSLAGMSSLTSASDIFVTGNPMLADLSGLSTITAVYSVLIIRNNALLTSLTGLPNLSYVGALTIDDNQALTSVAGLTALTVVSGGLSIGNNDALHDLSGFSGLTAISNYLNIEGNQMLTNLSGIAGVTFNLWNYFAIQNNPVLSYCEVTSVCNYLANPANPAYISGNATNCATRLAVETACLGPLVTLTCPVNTTVSACQTQSAVNTAYAGWLATASASGGCNGVLTNNSTGPPPACGGSATVTFTYTSTCAPLVSTCTATFTMALPPPVVLTCPPSTTIPACQTQVAVNAAYAAWLATASGSGGCNGVLTNSSAGAPSACGGSSTVTFTYSSTCALLTSTCSTTFTVSAAPPVVLTCPITTTMPACQTQAAVNAAYVAWLATASGSGGCNGIMTNNSSGPPSASGGSSTVTFTYTNSCAPSLTTCQATFTVMAGTTEICNNIDDDCDGLVDELDQDNDLVPDCVDNCISISNPDQLDYDGDGKGNLCDAILSVCSAIDLLITQVQAASIPNGIKNGLINRLNQAKTAYQNGNNSQTITRLNQFITQVQNQSGNNIPTATANAWIAIAQFIINASNNGNHNCTISQGIVAPTGDGNLQFEAHPGTLQVDLFWVTNLDGQTAKYELEKSLDGIQFQPLAERPANGSGGSWELYQEQDMLPADGVNFYRVKLHQLDGSTAYSEIRQVFVEHLPEFTLFPNPAADEVSINFSASEGKSCQTWICNSLSEVLKKQDFAALPDGLVGFSVADLPEGIYFVYVHVEERKPVSKMLVITHR